MSNTTATYRVDGMTCGGCVRALTRTLDADLPDAAKPFEVTLDQGGLVRIQGPHDPAQVSELVEDAGFDFVGAA